MAEELIYRNHCELKVCSKCGEAKARTEFNKERGRERAYCKTCHHESVKQWDRKNRHKTREYVRNWSLRNKDKMRAYYRKHEAKLTPEQKAKKAAYARRRHMARKYGITPEQWDELYKKQGGVCALCRIPGRVGKHGVLAIDHCHETGRVRGLLCGPCNVAIGILGETREQIMRVLEYVSGELIKV